MLEVRPVLFESDPRQTDTGSLTTSAGTTVMQESFRVLRASSCQPGGNHVDLSGPSGIYVVDFTEPCSKDWTYAGGLSPLGLKFNFLPRRRLEPFLLGNAGFLVATRDLPLEYTSRFNFTFEFGAGLELFQKPGRSVSLDYRFHHLSNDYTGAVNPGVDSGVFKVTYSFGR